MQKNKITFAESKNTLLGPRQVLIAKLLSHEKVGNCLVLNQATDNGDHWQIIQLSLSLLLHTISHLKNDVKETNLEGL